MSFISSLDIFRGFAALGVMVLHINRMVAQTESGTLGPWVEWLALGIDYFFVLSGFLMYYLHEKEAGDYKAISRYALKRIARIYPMFWLALAVSLVLIPLSQSLHYPPMQDIIKHVFLITPHIAPDGSGRVLGVAWTLELEMLFYLAFALWLWVGSTWMRMLWWVSAGVIAWYYPYALLFISGMCTAYIVKQYGPDTIRWPRWSLLLSFVAIVAVEAYDVGGHIEKVAFAAALSCFILSCIATESRYRTWVERLPRILFLSGTVSYTLYLMHIPLSLVLFTLLKKAGWLPLLPGIIWVVMLCVIVFALSALISVKLEHPVNRWLQRKIRQRYA